MVALVIDTVDTATHTIFTNCGNLHCSLHNILHVSRAHICHKEFVADWFELVGYTDDKDT